MITKRSISRAILNYCAQNNISQKELGAQIGIKQQSMNNWVWERTTPSFDNLVKLQSIIGSLEEENSPMIQSPFYLCYDKETDGIRLTMLKPHKERAEILIQYENEEQMLNLIFEDYFITYTLYQAAYERYFSLKEPFVKWRKKNKDKAHKWFEKNALDFYNLAMEKDRDYFWIKSRIINRIYNLTNKFPVTEENCEDVKLYKQDKGPCLD